jgi:hypothetical protein
MRGAWLGERWRVWKRVVWGPALAVVAVVYGIVAAFAFVRDDVLPVVLSAPDAKAWQAHLAPQLRFHWYWWVIGILATLLIVVLEGVFRVVRQEGRDRDTERRELNGRIEKLEAEKSKPDFAGTIDQTLSGQERGQPAETAVVVTMSILNRGAPSIARNYRAVAVLSGVRREAEMWYFENMNLATNDGTKLHATKADTMQEKTATRIETGAQIQGMLNLRLRGVTQAEFLRPGNAVEVSFEDFTGKTYVATQVFQQENAGVMYYPGGPRPKSSTRKAGRRN